MFILYYRFPGLSDEYTDGFMSFMDLMEFVNDVGLEVVTITKIA